MNRRDFITATAGGLVTTAASTLFSKAAFAHPGHGNKTYTVTKPAALKQLQVVAKTTAECITAGQACVQHCQEQLANGEKAFANCSLAVHQMLALCTAVGTLAAYKANVITDVLEACIKACEACKDACKEHQDHFAHNMHLECKRCLEACERCAQACRDLKSAL